MSTASQLQTGERNGDRIPLNVDGTMRGAVGDPIDVEIEDISPTGFRARVTAPLAAGDIVSIGISGMGVRPARVVRRDGDVVGCQFFSALPAEFVARLADSSAPIVVPAPLPMLRRGAAAAAALPDRYPMPMRLAAIVGLSLAGWGALIALATIL